MVDEQLANRWIKFLYKTGNCQKMKKKYEIWFNDFAFHFGQQKKYSRK